MSPSMVGATPKLPMVGPLPRRVLMTADAVGGVWDYALELSRGLGIAGIQVVLAVMGPPPDSGQREAARALGNVRLCARDLRLEWMEEPWGDVDAAGVWLLDLVARYDVELVHSNMFAFGSLPFEVPKLVVGHSCVLSWWRAVKGEPAPPSWEGYRQRVAAGLAGADAVVAPSAWMLEMLRAHYGLGPGGEVIRNGRRAEPYRSGEKQAYVLTAGRLWDDAKNAAALARVARRLPWPVRVAGAIRPVTGAGSSGVGAEIFDHVQCLGRLAPPALAAQYAAASLYALPARYEPFGLSVLEAALAGCALVLGDIPSLRELWADAAFFVDPGDDDGLAHALSSLIADTDRRQSLAARAQARAGELTAERMVDRYLTLYRRLAARERTADTRPEVTPACAS